MPCYFVARIQICDETEYARYLAQCDAVFAQYDGRYLSLDDAPVPLEGEPQSGRMVLISFPDEAAFYRWYHSPEYQAILAHRLKGAHCQAALIRGKD